MLLSEIFDQLTYSEFASLSLGNTLDNNNGIPAGSYPKVVSYVNAAITELHKRFMLREGELKIQLSEDKEYYRLVAANSISEDAINGFILDSAENKFIEDIIKIELIKDADGEEVALNDAQASYSAFIPTHNTLKIPDATEGDIWTVVYRQSLPKIVIEDGFDPEKVEVDLPDYLLKALVYYAASRAYMSMKTLETGVNEANMYLSRYENACNEVVALGLINDPNLEEVNLFKEQGWA